MFFPGNKTFRVILFSVLTIHLTIVLSILIHPRSVIWNLHNDTVHRKGKAADFFSVYHAGVNLDSGQSPYLDGNDRITPYHYSFRYLPIMAYFGKCMTAFPPYAAYCVWVLFIEAVLMVLIYSILLFLDTESLQLTVAVLLLLSSPYFLELYMGQFTFVTVAFCVTALLLKRLKWLYVLSVLIKPLTVIVLPLFLKLKKYRKTAVLAAAFGLLFSVPYFYKNPGDWLIFFSSNFDLTGGLDTGNFGFIRLCDLVARDLNVKIVELYWEFFVTSFRMLIFAFSISLVLLSENIQTSLGGAFLILSHFVSYQHVWEHHISAVLILGALLLTVESLEKWSVRLILLSMVLMALPTPFYFLDPVRDSLLRDPAILYGALGNYLLILPKAIPVLVLYLICLYEILRTAGFLKRMTRG